MPQPLFLHIRARGRSATRVLPLAGESIRVGRDPLCEVRLDDPTLAEVECFLRPRGETWHVQPLSPKGRMSIDGRPVLHLRALATNVPLRVGEATLVLRDTASIAPTFGAIEVPPTPEPVAPVWGGDLRDDERLGDNAYDPSRAVRPRPAPALAVPPPTPARDVPPIPARPGSPERTWEARWRAVGRSLKLRTQSATDPKVATRAPVGRPPDEPATVPFTPRSAPAPRVVDEPQAVEPSPAVSAECESAAVAWVMPIAMPGEVLRATTEVGTFDDAAPLSASTTAGASEPPGPPPDVAERRRVPRDRAPRRARPAEKPATTTDIAESRRRNDEDEWPSVQSILQAYQPPRRESVPTRRPAKTRPTPTAAASPAHWSPAAWLVAMPMAGAILAVGALGIFLGGAWGEDDRDAGLLADRLLRVRAASEPAIAEGEVNPDGTWWRTTSGHLALRAVALGSTRGDASREESTRFLLKTARQVAPLEPASRIARADLAATDRGEGSPLAALGLSRDTVALALTARTLAREGKTREALAAYRAALDLAVKAELGQSRAPAFLDEPDAKRFALPLEGLVGGVVREMAAQPNWTYETWSDALPEHGLVLLGAYRVLLDRGARESEDALVRLVECPDAPPAGSRPLHSAARAEGLAIKGRWEEAASLYAEAIAAVPDEAIRRTWHLNRGVILAGHGEVDKAADAMVAARAGRGDDAIGRKVADAMAREGIGRAAAKASPTSSAQTLRTN